MAEFWNRQFELTRIKKHLGQGQFGYITGRRRVGKTALLKKACQLYNGLYAQAVEGAPQQQIEHLVAEIADTLPIFRQLRPKNWTEFFNLLSREKLPRLVVFDEFSYWAQADPALPSILQRWIDHDLPKLKALFLVSGSSQSMLYSHFLNYKAPLYGRALLHLHLDPMNYAWFCRALGYRTSDPNSFERFSLVGGVPHYWRLMPRGRPWQQAQELYFEPSAILSEEPKNLIRDEGITGNIPKAILDLVGRGVNRPGEVAARLATAQGNLSRPLELLLKLGLVVRELPFGESLRTTKRALYSLHDPALSFYYGCTLPFRHQWEILTQKEKREIIKRHTARQWEFFCRQAYPGASRYWETDVEIDLVAPLKEHGRYLIAECKWSQLSKDKEKRLLDTLKNKFDKTQLSRKFNENIEFRIFSKKDLATLSRK